MEEKGFRAIGLQMLSLLVIWMVLCIPAYAEETGTTSGMSAKVYESMNEEGAVVANVIKDSRFTILSMETQEDGTEWYYICTDIGVKGYIQKTETILETEETQQDVEQTTQQKIEVIQNVNIREQPTTDSEIVGRVLSYTVLEPLQVQENETGEVWYQISYEGMTGYIRESAVELIEFIPESEAEEVTEAKQKENIEPEPVENYFEEQDGVEYTYQSLQEEVKVEDEKTGEENRETVLERTTRKAVNPIDYIVVFFVLGMLLSLLPVIFVQKAIRKEQQNYADKNRKMRRG